LLLISDLLGLNRDMNVGILRNLGMNGEFSVCYRNERVIVIITKTDVIKKIIIDLTDANKN
jgi:hypothetical protein